MKTSVRNIVLFSILLPWSYTAYTQAPGGNKDISSIDSLKKVLATQIADTNKVITLLRLSGSYRWHYPDSSLDYAHQALDLAGILNYEVGIFWSISAICGASILVGNYPVEIEYAFKALALSKKLNQPRMTGFANGMLSDYYYNLGEYHTSLNYWREVMKIIEQ